PGVGPTSRQSLALIALATSLSSSPRGRWPRLVHLDRGRHPLQRDLAEASEADVIVAAGESGDLGVHHGLSGFRDPGEAGGEVHRASVVVTVLEDHGPDRDAGVGGGQADIARGPTSIVASTAAAESRNENMTPSPSHLIAFPSRRATSPCTSR